MHINEDSTGYEAAAGVSPAGTASSTHEGRRRPLGRRALLGRAAVAGFGLVGASAIAACSPASSGPGGGGSPSAAAGGLELPSFIPYTGVEPDLPATEAGAAPFFENFPTNPVSAVSEKPLSGGEVNVLTFLNFNPTPMEKNGWWQAINNEVGGTVNLAGAPVGDYPSKFQVVVASNDLPDIAVILPDSTPEVGALLKSKFADLTPHLSGDAIADFPGLANIPTTSWRACVFNGGIYTLPIPRFSVQRAWLVRQDIAERLGVDPQPADGDALLDMMRTFTDEKEKRFATAHMWGLVDLLHAMHGTPNQWEVDDSGNFTRDYETDAFKAVLEVAALVWKERLVHPEGFDPNITLHVQDMYNNGTTPLFPGVTSWASNAIKAVQADSEAVSVAMKVNTWDGSGLAGRWLNTGAPYLAAIKQGDEDRVRELIGLTNWLASPWGTTEYHLKSYGVEGEDFTVEADGSIVRTPDGQNNQPSGFLYAGAPAMVHWSATHPDIARAEYEAEVDAMEMAVPLPTVGLESPTDQSKGAALTREMQDAASEIIQGRRPLASWDESVQRWRSKGGDKMREEFGMAHAERS